MELTFDLLNSRSRPPRSRGSGTSGARPRAGSRRGREGGRDRDPGRAATRADVDDRAIGRGDQSRRAESVVDEHRARRLPGRGSRSGPALRSPPRATGRDRRRHAGRSVRGAAREHDDEPVRLAALARRLDLGIVLQQLVHDPALDRGHRIELDAVAGGGRLLGGAAGSVSSAAARRARYPAASTTTRMLSSPCERWPIAFARYWSASIVCPWRPIRTPRSGPTSVATSSSPLSSIWTVAETPLAATVRSSSSRTRPPGPSRRRGSPRGAAARAPRRWR